VKCCIIPEKIGAGLTFSHLVTLTAYPAPGWVLTVALRGPSAIDLTASAEKNPHRISASAATTAAWVPGVYWYTARVTDGTDVIEVERGQLEITPDLASQTADFDGRTHAEKTLAAIEAVIEKRATLDQERYRINNRELYRTPITDLLKLRDLYRAEVRAERAAACGKSLFGATVRVRLQ
jgi:hypothetical protein